MEGGRGPTGIRPKFGGEFRRRLVADPAVQPFLIPIPLVFRSQNFGLHERTEKFPVRELRFHPAVERFAVTVLPRTARCNIQRRDLSCFQLPLDRSRDELWPVVRTNRSRRAVLRFQPRQDRHYILRRHPPLHFQRQTLAREFVHHRKPFQSPSVACFVHGEIPAPYVVLVLRFLHRAAVFAVPASAFSPLPQRLPQAFLPPQPLHALPVNLPSFSPQQPGHPPIPRTRMLLRQLVQPLANFSFSIIDARLIPLRRARLPHQPASVPFRVAVLVAKIIHRPSLARRAHQFFRLRSFSASMSMACCATIFFSRAFSFSSSFIRAISGPFIPPNWLRQR